MRDLLIETQGGRLCYLRSGECATIVNNILLSLHCRRGSWWFDRDFGLRELSKSVTDITHRADEYCKEAVRWILDSGRALQISFQFEEVTGGNRLNVSVYAVGITGQVVTFSTFIEVV